MDGSTARNQPPQPISRVAAPAAPVITPSPNPSTKQSTYSNLMAASFPDVYQSQYGEYSYFGPASVPKGASSEGFEVHEHENILDCWRRVGNNSVSRVPGYGWGGLYDWVYPQPLPLYTPSYMQSCIPYDTSKASVHVATGTTHNISGASVHMGNSATPYNSFKASGHTTNGTTPNNIWERSYVENGTLPDDISERSTRASNSFLNQDDLYSQYDTVGGYDRDLPQFFHSSHAIRRLECVKVGETPAFRRAVSILNYGMKGETVAKDIQLKAQLERLERAKQSMSAYPHANGGGISAHAVEATGSSAFIMKDAPLHVILESMQYLSDLLLSSRFDALELKDPDRELLQSVTDKLGAFNLRNKKVDTISFELEHDGQPEIKTYYEDDDSDTCTTNSASSDDDNSSEWEHVE